MKRWLLIDDVKSWNDVLKISFLYDEPKEKTYPDVEFHVATDYHEAVEMLEKQEWDRIYIDWELGGGRTGYDILHFLEEYPENLPKEIESCSGHSGHAADIWKKGQKLLGVENEE